jgi:hypothetical protein
MKRKLTPSDIKAIKASIAHWNRHATGKAGRNEGASGDDCALCQLHPGVPCDCPAWNDNGCCGGTYYSASNAHRFDAGNNQSKKFRLAAARVRDFLKGLLKP